MYALFIYTCALYLDRVHVLCKFYAVDFIILFVYAYLACYHVITTKRVVSICCERLVYFFMSIDYAYKQYILANHAELLTRQKRAQLYDYAITNLNNNGVVSYALRTNKPYYSSFNELLNYCIDNELTHELKECMKINHAEYERVKRLKERVRALLCRGSCLFLTLTFTDATLTKTTPKQRRVAVVRYLKQFDGAYIANIDFGVDKTKTMREHYHALIQCDRVDFTKWRKFGNINAEKVRLKDIDTDTIKLSKYVSKLTNHAIKEQAKRSSLIYSR